VSVASIGSIQSGSGAMAADRTRRDGRQVAARRPDSMSSQRAHIVGAEGPTSDSVGRQNAASTIGLAASG
jgi:hypothetical protein